MKFLLLNKNPIVKKLVSLSTAKAGVEADYYENIEDVPSFDYDYIFIDDEMIDDGIVETIREKSEARLGCFASKEKESPEGFDLHIQKPFLPTELVDLLTKAPEENAAINDDLDLGDLDDGSLSEDLGDLDLGDLEQDDDMVSNDSLEEELDMDSLGEDLMLDEDMDEPKMDEILPEDEELSLDEPELDADETDDELSDVDILGDEESLDEEDLLSTEEPLEDTDSLGETVEQTDEQPELEEELALEDDTGDMMDDTLGGVLNTEDISEIKGLLEEDEDTAQESLDTEIEDDLLLDEEIGLEDEDIKLENSELASLTEEALSEALGEEMQGDELEEDIIELDDETLGDTQFADTSLSLKQDTAAETKSTSLKTDNLGAIVGSLDIGKLKELLDGAEIKITISFPKKS